MPSADRTRLLADTLAVLDRNRYPFLVDQHELAAEAFRPCRQCSNAPHSSLRMHCHRPPFTVRVVDICCRQPPRPMTEQTPPCLPEPDIEAADPFDLRDVSTLIDGQQLGIRVSVAPESESADVLLVPTRMVVPFRLTALVALTMPLLVNHQCSERYDSIRHHIDSTTPDHLIGIGLIIRLVGN